MRRGEVVDEVDRPSITRMVRNLLIRFMDPKLESDYDSVSEWLRRWTRNPLGSARRGSNPLGVVFFLKTEIENVACVVKKLLVQKWFCGLMDKASPS